MGSPMNKRKLTLFASNVKAVTVKRPSSSSKQRLLFSRFFIVQRRHHDTILSSYLRKYNIPSLPRSIFIPDSQLYKSTDERYI